MKLFAGFVVGCLAYGILQQRNKIKILESELTQTKSKVQSLQLDKIKLEVELQLLKNNKGEG